MRTTFHAPVRLRQLGWMLLLWTASVLALGVAASIFRLVMSAAGLTEG